MLYYIRLGWVVVSLGFIAQGIRFDIEAGAAEEVQLQQIQVDTQGLNERQANGDLTLSRNGDVLMAYASQYYGINIYERSPDTGILELCNTMKAPQFTYPNMGAISHHGDILYQPHHFGLDVLKLDRKRWDWEIVQSIKTGSIIGMNRQGECFISPDGKSVYVSIPPEKILVCFKCDPATGKLTFDECLQDTTAGQPEEGSPKSKTILLRGKQVVIDLVLAKDVPQARKIEGLNRLKTLVFSADGKFAIGGEFPGKRLTVFTRDTKTGRLNVLEQHGGHPWMLSDGISGVSGIALLAKDEQVITASMLGGISRFNRNPQTGQLSFAQVFFERVAEEQITPAMQMLPQLRNACSVVVTPDNDLAFVACTDQSIVLIFKIDKKTYQLSHVGQAQQGVNGIKGLLSVMELAISPDGRFLYAAARDATVSAFEIKRTGGSKAVP